MKLELRGITKRFGSLVANDSIDLTVEPGEIHALLGENGAGKSTLMNVLYGLLPARRGRDPGRRPAGARSPGRATRSAAGIGMVHQHFMLIPVFTVAENVDARPRATPRRLGFLDRRRPSGEVAGGLRALRPAGAGPTPSSQDLPVGVQQRVEIVKALIRDAKVLILDEPTAVLTPQETDDLMRGHAARSAAGHLDRLHHPQAARGTRRRRPDHRHPPRQGRRRGAARLVGRAELASMMVGRPVQARRSTRSRPTPGDVVSRRRAASGSSTTRGSVLVDDVSFSVRGGRDLRPRRRPGQRPDRADRGAGRAEPPVERAAITLDGHDVTQAQRSTTVLDARRRLRPRGPAARRPGRQLHRRREPRPRPVRPRAVRHGLRPRPGRDRSRTPPTRVEEFDVRTPVDRRTRVARCPAATSRRSCSPASCPGRSTAARSSRSRPAVSTSARWSSCTSASSTERDTGTAVVLVSTELDEVLGLADRIARDVPRQDHRRGRRRAPTRERDRPADGRLDVPRARGGVVSNTESDVSATPASPPAPEPAAAGAAAGRLAGTSLREAIRRGHRCWRSCSRWSSARS